MVYLFSINEKIETDIKDVYRYSGIKENNDKNLQNAVLEVKKEVENAFTPTLCYTKISLENDTLNFLGEPVNSKNLQKNLKDCESVYVFAATAGIEIDRIINKYLTLSPSRAVIAQGAGTAITEALCNLFCKKIAEEEIKNNNYLRPRFSPGYGDFSLEYQKNILDILSAQKLTGITLTDSLLMVPVKSVTAVMGVSKKDTSCNLSGCEMCNKKECIYKRG